MRYSWNFKEPFSNQDKLKSLLDTDNYDRTYIPV